MQPPGRASRWLCPCSTWTPREGDTGGEHPWGPNVHVVPTPRTSSLCAAPALPDAQLGPKPAEKGKGGQRCPPGTHRAIGCARTRAASSRQPLPSLGASEFILLAASMLVKAFLSALFSQGSERGFCLLGLLPLPASSVGLGNWEPALGTGKGSELGTCSAPLVKPALAFLKASQQRRSHRPRGPESTPG